MTIDQRLHAMLATSGVKIYAILLCHDDILSYEALSLDLRSEFLDQVMVYEGPDSLTRSFAAVVLDGDIAPSIVAI